MELNVEKEMSSFEAHQDDSLKVLVADDNDSDRLILSTIIKNAGHEVVCETTRPGTGDCPAGQRAVDGRPLPGPGYVQSGADAAGDWCSWKPF